MSENSAKKTLMKAISPLDPRAIESPATGLGIPDVNFIGGWIEMKAMKFWPKNCWTHPVRFDHPLSKEQQVWLYRRERAGGLALVCAKVSQSWFFWSGRHIKENNLWDKMNRQQMIDESVLHFENRLDKNILLSYLRANGS